MTVLVEVSSGTLLAEPSDSTASCSLREHGSASAMVPLDSMMSSKKGPSMLTRTGSHSVNEAIVSLNRKSSGVISNESQPRQCWVVRVACILEANRYFNWFIAAVILLNSAYIGLETQVAWAAGVDQNIRMPWYAFEVVFVLIFMLEMGLRSIAHGRRLLCSGWNIFDFVIALVAMIDAFIISPMSSEGGPTDVVLVMRLARLARMLRILRVFRIVRFLQELRLMVMGMFSAMRTLFWAWMLLFLVIYICSIFVTRTIGQEATSLPEVQALFGTVPRSVFSLFQVLTVDDWVDLVLCAEQVEGTWFVRPFFVGFVIITTFAILNVVIAVIVEKTLENSLNHDKARLKDVTNDIKKSKQTVQQIFLMGDKDNDDTLSKEEFMEALSKPCVMRFLHEVGVEVRRADSLFDILDYDESGVLDLQEFVDGVMNARGEARSKEVLEIQCELWRWEQSTDKQLTSLRRAADEAAGAMSEEVAAIKAAVGRLGKAVASRVPARQSGRCTAHPPAD
mmetsp:Transcript_65236/g.147160  ORF Transcript_65236/g.147160 Transcript_65236/m.147160 type:complete len:508 (-) Transcript_65236:87-1610(-)